MDVKKAMDSNNEKLIYCCELQEEEEIMSVTGVNTYGNSGYSYQNVTGKTKQTKEELMQSLNDKKNEIYKKLQDGNTETTFHIGGQSLSLKEWDKLLEKFDAVQDSIKAVNKEDKDSEEKKSVTDNLKSNPDQTTLESLVSEVTKSTKPDSDSDCEDKLYITWYTEDGIFCREQGQTEGYYWNIPFDNKEQYNKVLSFLDRFDKKDNLQFTSDKSFWEKYLEGKINEDEIVDSYSADS